MINTVGMISLVLWKPFTCKRYASVEEPNHPFFIFLAGQGNLYWQLDPAVQQLCTGNNSSVTLLC